MISTSTFSRCFVLLALVAALVLAGCGREPSDDTDSTDTGSTTTEAASEPIEPPEAEESIEEATERISKAIEADRCDDLNEINLTTKPTDDEDERCELLQQLLGGKVLGTEEFDGLGGVVDYEYGDLGLSAVFVVELDGRFHLALADSLLEGESAGTTAASEFDSAAEDAFEALRDTDCEAFIAAANRRNGPGTAEEDQICEYVDANLVPGLVEAYPELEIEPIGANGDYALYSLATPDQHFTMVLARQEDPRTLSNDYEPLPDNAPEYGFVDLILTDRGERP